MTNKSFNPMFVSALDILTGALGVFIILNFLNTRLTGTVPPMPQPEIAAKEDKPEQPIARTPQQREYYNNGQRGTAKYKPAPPQPKYEPAKVEPKPETPQTRPTEQHPDNPSQEPVAVDLMKQTKGDVTLLLQQEGLAKQTVEFMLKQGNMSWKPSRASKYQNELFKYEKSLNYFYQVAITPGVYEVWVRIKRRNSGIQPFALYGKIIQPGMKTTTHNFGTFAAGSTDWVPAGTFTVLSNAISFKSALPAATPGQATDEKEVVPVKPPAPEPKKPGKWGSP